MENSISFSSPPVFILVLNLCDEDEELSSALLFWLIFLDSKLQCTSVSGKTHIIVVGSHADMLGKKERVRILEILSKSSNVTQFSNSFTFAGFIGMDCQYSESTGIRQLQKCIADCCKELREQNKYTSVNFNSHCVHSYLKEHMKGSLYVTLGDLIDHVWCYYMYF